MAFTETVYNVSGTNLVFASPEVALRYIERKRGISFEDAKSFDFGVGDFTEGAEVRTLRVDDQEVKILARRVVTEDNLDSALELNW